MDKKLRFDIGDTIKWKCAKEHESTHVILGSVVFQGENIYLICRENKETWVKEIELDEVKS